MLLRVIFILTFILTSWFRITTGQCITEAREKYRAGDYNGTILSLLQCPVNDSIASGFELLVAAYYHSGDLMMAKKFADRFHDSTLTGEMTSLKARISLARNDFHSAYRYYLLLWQSDSTQVQYVRQLALCADKLDSTQQAVSYYEKAWAMNPADQVSAMRLMDQYLGAERYIEADSIAGIVLERDSLKSVILLSAEARYALKNYTGAWERYWVLLEDGSSDPVLLRKAGASAFAIGETELAKSILSTSHMIKPDDELTCYFLAMTYQSLGDFKSSELFFRAAITNGFSPNLGNYYQRMGEMLETAGSYDKAIEALSNAAKFGNGHNRPIINAEIGRIYEVYFQDNESALRYYDHFLEAWPDTTDYRYKSVKNRAEQLRSSTR